MSPYLDPEQKRANDRRYYAANRARKREADRLYRTANTDRLRSAKRRWDEANPEKRKRYRAANRDAAFVRTLRRDHGMRPEDWTAMWDAQSGCCYLCEAELKPRSGASGTVIDHDHDCCPQGHSCSYCRRGLACSGCNKAIGLLRDDPALIRRVADNLAPVLAAARVRMATRPQQVELF